jgi:hypothetical protein
MPCAGHAQVCVQAIAAALLQSCGSPMCCYDGCAGMGKCFLKHCLHSWSTREPTLLVLGVFRYTLNHVTVTVTVAVLTLTQPAGGAQALTSRVLTHNCSPHVLSPRSVATAMICASCWWLRPGSISCGALRITCMKQHAAHYCWHAGRCWDIGRPQTSCSQHTQPASARRLHIHMPDEYTTAVGVPCQVCPRLHLSHLPLCTG